jgi:cytochrome oxidase Cu insertion factor (SCO1/SenC/PrrC family)
MKYFIILASVVALSLSARAQSDTTVPNYIQIPYIPPFKIQLADSSWYSKTNLQAKRPTLILYFSPDCGHCQLETEELLSRSKQLKNLQVVMITSRPYEDMANFAEHYKIDRFPFIKIGWDPQRFVTNFYSVKFTPFSALYDKKGKLVKVYEGGIDWDELISKL